MLYRGLGLSMWILYKKSLKILKG